MRPRKSREYIYVLTISRWDWGYSFGSNNVPHLFSGPYLDHRHLDLHGKIVRPTRYVGEPVKLTLIPTPDLDPRSWSGEAPEWVAHLNHHRKAFTAVLPFPADALPPLLTALGVGHIRYATLSGDPLDRGGARIRSWHLDAGYDPDGLPPEPELAEASVRRRTVGRQGSGDTGTASDK